MFPHHRQRPNPMRSLHALAQVVAGFALLLAAGVGEAQAPQAAF